LDHEARIEEAVVYLLANLDAPTDLGQLADRVCLSRFHFHRVFQALLGESLGEMVRRLRLERAAHALTTTAEPVTRIAFDAGYTTLEAFIRAFRTAFGATPSTFRRGFTHHGHLPTPNGLHFDDPRAERLRFVRPRGESPMKIEVRESAPLRVACMAYQGPYPMIGAKFGEVAQWRAENDVPLAPYVGIYYDDPSAVPPDQLRAHAGIVVADDFASNDPRIEIVTLAGGTYAVGTHVGAYDGIGQSWMEMWSQWFPSSGYEVGETPPFEVYVDDCDVVPIDQARTELFLSVKA
jgi:AraC family transcriptional regulator